MGDAFEARQVGVKGNSRLVVAQGKGRKQPCMRTRPNLEGPSVLWAVVNQPHYAELKWVAVGVAAIRLSCLVTVGQRTVNPSCTLIAQGWIRWPTRPSGAITAHRQSVHHRLAKVAAR